MKFGIIGAGWVTENLYLPVLQKIPGIEIAGLCEPDGERREYIKKKFSLPFVSPDMKGLLASGPGAVVVATPNYLHEAHVLAVLEAGKHVICEKPFALDGPGAQRMVAAAVRRGLCLMPAFVNYFRKDIAAIRDKVKKGDIGRVLEVRAAWMRKNGVPKPGSWFTQSRFSGGGVLMDLGPHLLPICLDLVGDHPLRISTAVLRCDSKTREKRGAQWYSSDQKAGGQMNVEMDVEDTLSALMVFENNSSIHLDLSWDAPVPGDVTSFKVVGSKGTLELDTLFGMSPQRLHEKDRLAVYNHNTGKTSVEQKKPEHNLTMEAFFNMIRHFIAVIEKKAEPEISGKDAIRTVTVTGGIYKNYKL